MYITLLYIIISVWVVLGYSSFVFKWMCLYIFQGIGNVYLGVVEYNFFERMGPCRGPFSVA